MWGKGMDFKKEGWRGEKRKEKRGGKGQNFGL
jgi:hypothetical protein